MTKFRVLLMTIFVIIAGYTMIVIKNHGWDLFTIFFGDIYKMEWSGQFNVDFMSFLTLSALWLSWRHNFSPLGIILGVMGFFGGGLFLSLYLLVASITSGGEAKVLLLGRKRSVE